MQNVPASSPFTRAVEMSAMPRSAPRCVRIRSINADSRMAVMILSRAHPTYAHQRSTRGPIRAPSNAVIAMPAEYQTATKAGDGSKQAKA